MAQVALDETLDEERCEQTALAHREFLDQVACISGVTVAVGGASILDRSYIVEVPSLRSNESDRVYTIRGKLFRAYPLARLAVTVRGRRELEAAVYREDLDDES